ncbi:MAG: TIM44-like domain-containing protein [Hyphomicrobiales bacterium]|jgi:predicted lipid-binding transport protein (Tim44 family)|nr:TIM44-like domain-containing protein [Hyphomicrobiales bacterium]
MSKTLNRLALMTMMAGVVAFGITAVDARPGSGKSSGSRGSQTNVAPPSTSTAPGTAQPMQRSVTPAGPAAAAAPAAGAAAGAAGAAAAAAKPSMARSLMMGLGAGLLGAGLFGLLSGAGFLSGLGSLAGMLGFLLQIALIGGVIFLIVRLIRGRRETAMAAPAAGMARDAQASQNPTQRQMMGGLMGGAAQPAQPAIQPLDLTGDDFGAFEKLLVDVQTAYGAENVPALRAMLTPEMSAYFEGDLSDNEARGAVNKIANVKLLQGDLSEAWREAGGEYATVAMRYAISDALVDRRTGRTIEGDLAKVGEVTEVWTFVREPNTAQAGWKLSAIQQVA